MGRRRASGEGSIYRRADGRYVAALFVDGKRRQRYSHTEAEAVRDLDALKRERDDGLAHRDPRQTTGDFFNWWIDTVIRPSKRAPKTKESYEGLVRNHIVPILGHVKLRVIDADDIARCVYQIQDGGHQRTAEMTYGLLRQGLADAVRRRLLDRNPVDLMEKPKRSSTPERKVPLVGDRLEAFVVASQQHRLAPLWTVLLVMGLRKGEALALQWSDIDFSSGTMSVSGSLKFVKGQGHVIGSLKTRSSRRTLVVPEFVLTQLRSHAAQQAIDRFQALDSWPPSDLVFTTGAGKPIGLSSVNRQLDTVLRRAGLPPIRVHDLRHTAATTLLQGVGFDFSLFDVSWHLGHSGISMTSDTYGHLVESVQRDKMTRVDSFFTAMPGFAASKLST